MEYILFLEEKKQQRTSRLKIFINLSTRETNAANILTEHGMMESLSKVFICLCICVMYIHTNFYTHKKIYIFMYLTIRKMRNVDESNWYLKKKKNHHHKKHRMAI